MIQYITVPNCNCYIPSALPKNYFEMTFSCFGCILFYILIVRSIIFHEQVSVCRVDHVVTAKETGWKGEGVNLQALYAHYLEGRFCLYQLDGNVQNFQFSDKTLLMSAART